MQPHFDVVRGHGHHWCELAPTCMRSRCIWSRLTSPGTNTESFDPITMRGLVATSNLPSPLPSLTRYGALPAAHAQSGDKNGPAKFKVQGQSRRGGDCELPT